MKLDHSAQHRLYQLFLFSYNSVPVKVMYKQEVEMIFVWNVAGQWHIPPINNRVLVAPPRRKDLVLPLPHQPQSICPLHKNGISFPPHP